MSARAPILVDRALLPTAEAPIGNRLMRRFAEMNRLDRPLVLLAERPDRWTPTRNRVDRALEGQSRLEADIQRGGGALDAVLYLDFGLFSRQRRRHDALSDLADRYGVESQQLIALVASARMADALTEAVGVVRRLGDEASLAVELRSLLREGGGSG
ncbi:hypothetical protein HFP89_01400 [Wenzhouxiangella sp. XN79A]|uniref:hypothetical protein n=1 Tax=Wenzhouxiangella sp. XN79A TaxID=2724193 RepID=UPI00144A6930|nr:hypothetical protein [Wenzhouxiangella sp. XN79A]NKI33818.1 hypothetical protein [Wenzhouxiangella sp. XN79A]